MTGQRQYAQGRPVWLINIGEKKAGRNPPFRSFTCQLRNGPSNVGDNTQHGTHGRPITAKVAAAQGLNITSLENDPDLQDKVLSVFHAVQVTFLTTQSVKIVENHNGKGLYTIAQTGN